jgi:hypothetical protein
MPPLPTFRMPEIAVGVGAPKVVTISAALAPSVPKRRQPTPASVAAAARALGQKTAVRTASASAPRPAARAPAPAVVAAPAPPARTSLNPLALAAPVVPLGLRLRPTISCAPDEQRIQNYAGRIVQGLGLAPTDDLRLFESDGRPLPNLARVMLAMSSVELGVLRASAALVESAIARATPRMESAAGVTGPDIARTPPL